MLETDAINELLEPAQAAAVRTLLEPTIRRRGLELIQVEIKREDERWILRLYVGPSAEQAAAQVGPPVTPPEFLADEPTSPSSPGSRQGGVSLRDCQEISREVSALLDVEDPIPHEYVLEVSSPGLDRPLVKPSDFAHFAGREVRLRTSRKVNGQANFRGRLVGLRGGDVVVTEPDGEKIVPYGIIKRAHLVYEF